MPESDASAASGDRYRQVGLEANPFAAPPHDAPPLASFVSRGLPDPPPPASRTLVQVIGESGLGKSTQVHHWRSLTPGPYHWVPRTPYASRWKQPPQAVDLQGIVYGDEIDRMPVPVRRRWFRSLAAAQTTLVIGTHVDLAALGSRSGFRVVTHHLQPADAALLALIANGRLRSVASSDEPFQFSIADVAAVATQCRGNPGAADELFHKLLAERVHGQTTGQTLRSDTVAQ